MSAPVDPYEVGHSAGVSIPEAAALNAAAAIGPETPEELGNTLPGDHPAWARDVVSLSARFRAMVARMQPIVVRVIAYWEHRVRSIMVGGRRLGVDASGCYRME